MTDKPFSRRAFIRSAAISLPVIGAAVAIPTAAADPSECSGNCAPELPQQFTATSFSTTAIVGGTNYSILFSTNIRRGPGVPSGATGYRITSVSVSGTKPDGSPFDLTPGIGEVGPRLLNARSASSLGFALDVPWNANELMRSFVYTYDVQFLTGLTGIQTCRYATNMTLADNRMTLGGVGSVTFSTPTLVDCGA